MAASQRTTRPKNFTDLTGNRYGFWTVVGYATPNRVTRWKCRCDCGVERVVLRESLVKGKSSSCGCQKMSSRIKHGCAGTRIYFVWHSMLRRCADEKMEFYHRYGGRGISVCDRWKASFTNFVNDMGPRPTPKHQIERIDNDGNYCPENCCWSTANEQARNRSDTPRITINGVTKTRLEWCDVYSIKEATVRKRIYKGMDPELAVTMPLTAYQRRRSSP